MSIAFLAAPLAAGGHAPLDEKDVRPDAIVDLRTAAGAALVGADWRFAEAKIIDIAGGARDIAPHAQAKDFNDSGWERVAATDLEKRRGPGHVSFAWYRTQITLPAKLGDTDITGATVVFEVTVDDYAEIWIDGQLPVVLGQVGGPMVAGFNAPNRVVLTRAAKAGQSFHIAVFGMNGPISLSPENRIWVRSAALDVYRPAATQESAGTIERVDSALDAIVPKDARIEKIAGGFLFTEGPVWHPDGYLLFSDPNANRIYRYQPDNGQVSIYYTNSGYSGVDIGRYHQPGSNGLAIEPKTGLVTLDQHGNRRVVRLEKKGDVTVLADTYEGKRLNSPNDLVYRSDGALYFTDPPFGLPKVFDDPAKELPYSGVFLLRDGKLKLVAKDVTGPNGLAFSPDEKFLYVTNWDEKKKVVMRYAVARDGALSDGKIFFDMTSAKGEEALDGIKVDALGNLFVSGPGGVWILSAAGKHLGTMKVAELPANMAWGDADGRALYMTARTGVYRVRLPNPGAKP